MAARAPLTDGDFVVSCRASPARHQMGEEARRPSDLLWTVDIRTGITIGQIRSGLLIDVGACEI
jgi:hypothetical protein